MLRALELEECKKPLVAILATNKDCPTSGGGFLFLFLPIVHKDVKQNYYFNEERETKR